MHAILKQGASLHFVLEDVVIRNPPDIEPVEEILSIHNLLPARRRICPTAKPPLRSDGKAAPRVPVWHLPAFECAHG